MSQYYTVIAYKKKDFLCINRNVRLHFFLAILAAVCYSEYTDKEFQVYNHS